MITPLTIERFNDFKRRYPDSKNWEDAVAEANDKYDELFGKYFPITYYSSAQIEIHPDLKTYPSIGTVCLWHAIMDCVERRQEYEIPASLLKISNDPNICGVIA